MDRIDTHLHVGRYNTADFRRIASVGAPALDRRCGRGLAYDILVRGRAQSAAVPAFVAALPDGALVLHHGGKPDIAAGKWQPWADMIADSLMSPASCREW